MKPSLVGGFSRSAHGDRAAVAKREAHAMKGLDMTDEITPQEPAPETPAVQEPAAPAEKMYTQAELNAAAAAARKADKDKLKELEAKAARADELEAEKLSATERAEKAAADALARAEAAEKALEAATLASLRSSIGAKHGLTPLQASRLVGATEDEIEADAVAFAADLPKPEAPGARPAGEPNADDPVLNAFLGK